MRKEISALDIKFERLINSELLSFDIVAAQKDIMGVYVIYQPDKSVLYIGNTNKFHIRFGTDLKHESTHTLVKKLMNTDRHKDNRSSAVNFLMTECKMRIEICIDKREAEALEHIAIHILQPLLNRK